MKFRLGFFYIGYKKNLFYWEFVIIYRKIATICVSLLKDVSIFGKAALIIFINLASLFAHISKRPFVNKRLNYLEDLAIKVSTFTIFGGMLYIQNSFKDVSKALIFVIIIIMNFLFIFTWSVIVLRFTFKKLSKDKLLKSFFRLLKKFTHQINIQTSVIFFVSFIYITILKGEKNKAAFKKNLPK